MPITTEITDNRAGVGVARRPYRKVEISTGYVSKSKASNRFLSETLNAIILTMLNSEKDLMTTHQHLQSVKIGKCSSALLHNK